MKKRRKRDHRLVWARDGRLRSARMRAARLVEERELFDFTPMPFEAIAAPY